MAFILIREFDAGPKRRIIFIMLDFLHTDKDFQNDDEICADHMTRPYDSGFIHTDTHNLHINTILMKKKTTQNKTTE